MNQIRTKYILRDVAAFFTQMMDVITVCKDSTCIHMCIIAKPPLHTNKCIITAIRQIIFKVKQNVCITNAFIPGKMSFQ